MRLIATLGANRENLEHKYAIENIIYKTYFSFQALAKHFKIKDEDIYIIGTSQTEEMLVRLHADCKIPHYTIKQVNNEDPKDVMEASLELIDDNSIIDLTQGLRSHPMITLIASIYSRSLEGKKVKDIFYAQIIDSTKIPSKEMCQYNFNSLIEYLDMSNIASVIETFTKSLVVPIFSIASKDFKPLEDELSKLSSELLINNIDKAIATANSVKQKILTISKKENLKHLSELFNSLLIDIETIVSINPVNEHEKYLVISNLFFGKKLYLQAITTLFEASLAHLEYYVIKHNISVLGPKDLHNSFKGDDDCLKNHKQPYARRNCLKKGIKKHYLKTNPNDLIMVELNKIINDLDKKRNLAAHAFLEDSSKFENIEEYIQQKINSLLTLQKQIDA